MRGFLINFLVCLSFSYASSGDMPDSVQTGRAIETPEEAVERALEYTGIERSKTYVSKSPEDIAELTRVADSLTPFISDTINSKEVWLVKFTNIQLQPFKETEPNDLYPKDFNVILDPETGNLLKINSSFFEFKADRRYEYPPELKIKDPGGLQSFFGFPEDPPSGSFYDVVKVWHSNCTIGVKHISATYILQSHPMYGTKGYWCITFRGIAGGSKRIAISTKVVDPESGKVVTIAGEMKGSIFGH